MSKPTGPRVFVVDDDELIVSMLSRALRREGYEVRGAERARGLAGAVSTWSPDVVMLDINLPDGNGLDLLHELRGRGVDADIVMLTADDTAASALKAIRQGAVDYLTKPFELEEVKAVLAKIVEQRRLKREVAYLKRVAGKRPNEIIGSSPAIAEARAQLEKLAAAGVATVLITGESGTGKELMARYLHRLVHGTPDSADSPFIAVNCAALPANLIESELFGYEKGAFTDAKGDKKGVFELAHGGSILLDEIGEMPRELQSKLLRVLEERSVRRIGGKETIAFDATVIAATNRDLAAATRTGEFRGDLLYRLNAFAVSVPPLRERGRDVLELAGHFLGRFAERYGKRRPGGFSAEAEAALLAYPWPGNVRELRNVVERIVVLEVGGEGVHQVGTEHLPREITDAAPAATPAPAPAGFDTPSLEEVKRRLIVDALEKAHHNRAQAAKLLKVSYDTLRYQMKKFGLG